MQLSTPDTLHPRRWHKTSLLLFSASLAALSGCTTTSNILTFTDVKPWERGTLAREDMQLVTDNIELSVDEHIYYSKEASTGGVSVQGGGCGCN